MGLFIASKAYRGKGLGTVAIHTAIIEAKRLLLFSRVELRVRATNSNAIHCYTKCGFREESRFRKRVHDNDFEVVYMLRNV